MRGLAIRLVTFGMVLSSAFMAWKLMTCLNGSEPPFTILVDDSMGPGLRKGDILMVQTDFFPIQCGDVIMFHVKEGSTPIVHRVIQVKKCLNTGEVYLLTKGDSSAEDDRSGIYTSDQLWLNPKDHVIGRGVGYIPYVGWAMIFVSFHPFIKYMLLGAISLLVLTPKSNNCFGQLKKPA